jgi:hypothetical protein
MVVHWQRKMLIELSLKGAVPSVVDTEMPVTAKTVSTYRLPPAAVTPTESPAELISARLLMPKSPCRLNIRRAVTPIPSSESFPSRPCTSMLGTVGTWNATPYVPPTAETPTNVAMSSPAPKSTAWAPPMNTA